MVWIVAFIMFIIGIACIREIVATEGRCDGSDRKSQSGRGTALQKATKTITHRSEQPGFTLVWNEEVNVIQHEQILVLNPRKCSRKRG
jgi:hypothetical protein